MINWLRIVEIDLGNNSQAGFYFPANPDIFLNRSYIISDGEDPDFGLLPGWNV